MAERYSGQTGELMRRYLAPLTLLLIVALPAALWAGYRISVAGDFIDTATYYIAGDSLYLEDGNKSVPLAMVDSIARTERTATEQVVYADSVAQFRIELDGIDRGTAELALLLDDTDRIAVYLGQLENANKWTIRIIDAKYDARRNLDRADSLNQEVKLRLNALKVPERELLPLRDARLLHLGTLAMVASDYRRFIKTGDSLYLKYAEEHRRQAAAFKQRYEELSQAIN